MTDLGTRPPYLGSTPSPTRLHHVFDRAMKIRFDFIDMVGSYVFLRPYGKMIDLGTDEGKPIQTRNPAAGY